MAFYCGLVRGLCESKVSSCLCCDCLNGVWEWDMWRGTQWSCPHNLGRDSYRVCMFLHTLEHFLFSSDLSKCKCLLFSLSPVSSCCFLWTRMLLVEVVTDYKDEGDSPWWSHKGLSPLVQPQWCGCANMDFTPGNLSVLWQILPQHPSP